MYSYTVGIWWEHFIGRNSQHYDIKIIEYNILPFISIVKAQDAEKSILLQNIRHGLKICLYILRP